MAFTYNDKYYTFGPKMLKLLIVLTCLIFVQKLSAQGPRPIPNPYPSNANINFIRTWNPTAPEESPNTLMTRSLNDVKEITQYIDGLGRPLQTVIKQGSLATGSNAVDFVTAIEYDQFGREIYKYLPFAANSTGGNTHITDGVFKLNPFQQQAAFMQQQYGLQKEIFYYNQTSMEPSPLNRIDTNLVAGNNWVGSKRGVVTKYFLNTTTDSIRIWRVTNVANNWGTYSSTAFYAPGELFKKIIEDEQGNQIIEFKDKEDKTILKKAQLTSVKDTGLGKGYTGWICTYFIYDNSNNLRCVVQPRGVELLITNSWNIDALSGAILNEQCFRYEYDQRNRMIRKKVPGAGEVWTVYDARDRVVLTQDAILRTKQKWIYTQYDALNRQIATGFMTDPTNYNNLTYHLTQAYTSSTYPNLGGYVTEEMSQTFYDTYTWLSSQGNPFTSTRFTSDDTEFFVPSNSTTPYAQPFIQNENPIGQITGTKIKVLGSSTYLYSIMLYDVLGRIMQTKSHNISGGTDIESHQYDFAGKTLISILRHQKSGTNTQTHVIVTKRDYDDLSRLTQVQKKVTSTVTGFNIPVYWRTVADYEYDSLSQLKKTKLSPSLNLETLINDYNIRGWTLGVNRAYTKDSLSTANYFGFDLGYDKDTIIINGTNKLYAGKQYNGNIAGMLWKSTGDDRIRKYDFTYDAANRIAGAIFTQLTNNVFNVNAGIDFSATGFSYDANSNILAMNQKGWKPGGSQTIDSLLYTYKSYSNRLENVLDRKNDTATRLGDFRSSKTYMDALSQNKTTSEIDYVYDDNGNLVKDLNKDIKRGSSNGIAHNHLNLPDTIWVNGKGRIVYTYDGTGKKLKKVVIDSTAIPVSTTTTLYIGGIEYSNDTLQFIAFEEGRIRLKKEDTTLAYDYFIKDHLGNIRMVLTEEQQTNVYPLVTFEDATLTNELIYYDSVDQERVARPGSFFTSGTNGSMVQLLRKSTQPIGTGKLLKVMANDRLHVKVDYFTPDDPTDNTNANGLNSVIATLTSVLNAVSAPVALKGSGSAITNILDDPGAFVNFLAPQGTGVNSSIPKAYLNILFFDEQFNFVQENSEIVQITTKGSGQQIFRISGNAKVATKNGYAYIYLSNESNNLVYFDNFQISHERGALLEETHYYPFGLTMAGISSSAFGKLGNKKKYNGIEQTVDLSLNQYDAFYRNLDPQIGRWWQLDPKPSEALSLYAAMDLNPIRYMDPLGDTSIPIVSMFKLAMRYSPGGIGAGADLIPENKTGEAIVGAMLGAGEAGRDALVGIKNAVTHPGQTLMAITMPSLKAQAVTARTIITNYNNSEQQFGSTFTNSRFVSYGLTSFLISIYGPKVVQGVNRTVATAYVNYTSKGTFSSVSGFSLRLGSRDFAYHNSLSNATKSPWSTPTSFSSDVKAFNSLALDYTNTTNFAQMKFSLRNWGVFVKGTAATQGTTLGGGTQLLKTPFSLRTNVQPIPFKTP